ncbi:AAA family ATPase [Candidatus Marinimicrobia bacterium]|nr:AAA family ATPase [Candidatus Neomarinimicrobiota bacterium]
MKSFNTKIIALSNQKGGVGKTTSAVNIASFLAITETPVLIIDMDPQANASTALGIQKNEVSQSIYEVIINNINIKKCIQKTEIDYLDIVPSSSQLAGAEIELVSMFTRESVLKESLREVMGKYKYIIIDCPPSLGLLTINVLTASHSIIIPVQCEYYALEGLSQLLNTIRKIQNNLNTKLEIEGILVTMYDSRLNLSQQVLQEVKEYFGEKVYKTLINRNVRLGEAPSYGKPIVLYDAASTGSQNYMNLVSEILNKNG